MLAPLFVGHVRHKIRPSDVMEVHEKRFHSWAFVQFDHDSVPVAVSVNAG